MIDNDENEIPHVNQGAGGHMEGRRLEKLSTQFSACELSKVTTGHNPKSNGQQNKFGADRGVGGLGWEGQLKSDALFVIPRDCHTVSHSVTLPTASVRAKPFDVPHHPR